MKLDDQSVIVQQIGKEGEVVGYELKDGCKIRGSESLEEVE